MRPAAHALKTLDRALTLTQENRSALTVYLYQDGAGRFHVEVNSLHGFPRPAYAGEFETLEQAEQYYRAVQRMIGAA